MPRRIIYREVPKPPGPSGSIGTNLWRALCDRHNSDYNEYQEIYLEVGDIDWLEGYAVATPDPLDRTQIFQLVKAIRQLGQVEVVWVNE